jgi:hypothetical protein
MQRQHQAATASWQGRVPCPEQLTRARLRLTNSGIIDCPSAMLMSILMLQHIPTNGRHVPQISQGVQTVQFASQQNTAGQLKSSLARRRRAVRVVWSLARVL